MINEERAWWRTMWVLSLVYALIVILAMLWIAYVVIHFIRKWW